MTDLDVLEHARKIAGLGKIYGPYKYGENRKVCWNWTVNKHAEVYALIVAMYPWLHSRRKERATEVIKKLAAGPADNARRTRARATVSAVVEDRHQTGASQWELARRHGISRSRVQQIVTTEWKVRDNCGCRGCTVIRDGHPKDTCVLCGGKPFGPHSSMTALVCERHAGR